MENPFEAPSAPLLVDRCANAPTFHHISPLKFVVMSVMTLCIYPFYWFYRCWKWFEKNDDPDCIPFLRAFFGVFWFYPLLRQIERRLGTALVPSAPLLTLAFILCQLAWRLPFPGALLGFGQIVLVLPAVRAVDRINRKAGTANVDYSRFRWRHWFTLAAGGGILLLFLSTAVVMQLGVTGETSVVTGDNLSEEQLEFFAENGLLEEGEEVRFFYSAGFFLADDGNLVTDRRVLSYWQQEDGLTYKAARYEEITDVEVQDSDSLWTDTEIWISTDVERFMMWASAEGDGDEPFVEAIMMRWGFVRPELAAAKQAELENRSSP